MSSIQEQEEFDVAAPIEQVDHTFRESERNRDHSPISSQAIEHEEIRNENDMDEPEQIPSPEMQNESLSDVFQDAAIYLNEGLDNDKFDNHPTRSTIKWYNIAHSTWYNIVDLMASALLLSLALTERTDVGKDNVLSLPVLAHGLLEISALTILAFGVIIKMKWQGVKSYLTHKRSFFKLITLCIMYVEAIVVMARSKNHVRVTRALRPLFLIDSNYLRGTRRVLRQIVLSLPPILDMLVLLFFFIFIFSMLGFYLFSSNSKDVFFTTFQRSFISLFVLLTTANFPDVMMPSYAESRWSVIFFITYVSIAIYFLMNLLLAVVYETFTSIEKHKFRKLYLHKIHAARLAFDRLCNRNPLQLIAQPQFQNLMKFFKPKHDALQNYLVYKSLEKEVKGGLNFQEFCEVFEKKEFVWKKASEYDMEWFSFMRNKPRCQFLYYPLKGIYWLINGKPFKIVIYIIIIVNGCSFIYEIVMLSNSPPEKRKIEATKNHWYSIVFITIYGTEALLKLLGLGLSRYFESGWNWFDFIVTVLGIIGLIVSNFSFSYILCLRPLRLLLLFKIKKRYRDILDTMWILAPRMFRVMLAVMCLYYSFGIVGMECFAGLNLKDCCRNISVGQSFQEDGYYYLNNFDDLIHAVVTLFELTVVNNWFIIMEGIVHLTSDWSRIYFMLFYIITMVVMTIVVAFILEAFLFRISYRKEHPTDEETDMSIKTEVEVTFEELMALDSKYCLGLEPGQSVTYRGNRHKTKMDLSMKMYHAEIEEWKKNERVFNLTETFEQREIRQEDSLLTRIVASLPPSLSRLAKQKRTFKRRKTRKASRQNSNNVV